MTGYLNVRQAAQFLGGRSVSWLRSHLHQIPHKKLFDRLIFRADELERWVEMNAEKHVPIDIDSVVREVMGSKKKRAAG